MEEAARHTLEPAPEVFTPVDATRCIAASRPKRGMWKREPNPAALAADLNMIAPAFVDYGLPPRGVAKARMLAISRSLAGAAEILQRPQKESFWPDGQVLFRLWVSLLEGSGYRPAQDSELQSEWTLASTVLLEISKAAEDWVRHADTRLTSQIRQYSFNLYMLAYMFRKHTGYRIGQNADGPAARFCAEALRHLHHRPPTPAQWVSAVTAGNQGPLGSGNADPTVGDLDT